MVELGDQLERGIGIVEIIVAQLLALNLGRGHDAGPRVARAVERGILVRILAIAERIDHRS